MDAQAYLIRHGWSGPGNPLNPNRRPGAHSGLGLTRPILVARRQNNHGVGKKTTKDHTNQWWLRGFEDALKGVGERDVQSASASASGPGSGSGTRRGLSGELYKFFVRGDTLVGSIKEKEVDDGKMKKGKRKRDEDKRMVAQEDISDENETKAAKKRRKEEGKQEKETKGKRRGKEAIEEAREDEKKKIRKSRDKVDDTLSDTSDSLRKAPKKRKKGKPTTVETVADEAYPTPAYSEDEQGHASDHGGGTGSKAKISAQVEERKQERKNKSKKSKKRSPKTEGRPDSDLVIPAKESRKDKKTSKA